MSSITGLGMTSSLSIQTLVDMRNQLVDLQRQLGTGQKSDTYAGVGLDRGLAVGLRAHLSAIQGYQASITQVGVRLDLAQTALSQFSSIGQSAKTTVLTSQFALNGSNQTRDQQTAALQLDQVLSLLNTNTGGRYLFSGKAVDQAAVVTPGEILDGVGAKAGLKQIISERRAADLGANGLGRLVVSAPSATEVDLAEDAISPFGFKIAGLTSNLTGATVIGPAGAPTAVGIDLGPGNPNDGETVRFTFTLPDGTSQDLTLTATTASPPAENQFTIGGNSAITATNLQAALTHALGKLGGTALTAASAVAAGDNFFNTDDANPPQRVAGPPFDTATSLVAGTPANTVKWYTGEAGTDSARSTSVVRADQSLSLQYGMRANEQALRSTVQSIAVFAAVSFSQSDPNAQQAYAALQHRLSTQLAGPVGQQQVSDIQGALAATQTAMAASKDRHNQTTSTLDQVVQDVEGAPTERVAAQILALQTSLQATLQTTAMLLQTNLLKYL